MKARLTPLALLITALSFTSLAHAGSESGIYIGGSLGNAELNYGDDLAEIGSIDFKDDDTAYKIFAGYNFGILPLLDLAVEGSYMDFGSQNDLDTQIDVNGWNVSGLAGINLGPIGLFGKAGVIDWDSNIEHVSLDQSRSGTDPIYGLGAKVHLGSFSIRAEYEIVEADKADIDFYSVGAAITF
ncbi:outer membrane beta-barrel protein [Gilvimarinus sp. SDUM040013]|uniref:Outer membrane beta-barrel protein n=1 Tax=Gilvimarinus gilvus TaxID=3058038 RepID=A0ABU4RXA0_9GAMM|nr:outer membrane beta-barrel protein [Gilvimarinus sp. SDUM040013]MDO3386620.1 outer membrane beta-barrel protein [Gilvimarinus sp. SDUM040013]MDX6849493.1 outer membrane beta-barrel protein [Gilvimarinus sp. SDUM040013]